MEGFSEGLFKPSNRPLLLCLSCVSLTFILQGQDRVASLVYIVPSLENTVPSLTASVSQLSLRPLISSALLSLWSTAIWSVRGIQETEAPSLVSGGQIASQRSYYGPWVLGTEFSYCVSKEFNVEKNLPSPMLFSVNESWLPHS